MGTKKKCETWETERIEKSEKWDILEMWNMRSGKGETWEMIKIEECEK